MNDAVCFLKRHEGALLNQSPSAFMRWLGGRFEVAERGTISCNFIVRYDMLNPARTLHGGVMAGILDEMVGMCVFILGLEHIYKSAHVGETLRAKAEVIREGSCLIYGHASLHCGERLIASSSLSRTPLKSPDVTSGA
jgi:acyl-coenzyme A thioesterase PaaI-like protein